MPLRIPIKVAALASVGVVCCVGTTAGLAQTSSTGAVAGAEAASTPAQHLLTDRFVINAGAFVLATSLNGSLNGTANSPASGVSHDVDFNEAFGMNGDDTRIRADALWRVLPRHHVRFLYFDNDVKRTRSLDEDVVWGDYTFKAAAQATAENKFTVYELVYEYAFMREHKYEVVGSAGIHYTEQTIRISGSATVTLPDGTVQAASFQTKSDSLATPLPVMGLRGAWAVAPAWFLDASAQFFGYRANPYDGNWWELGASATWMYKNHVGIGAGWNRFTTHADIDKTNFQGHLNFSYSGLLVFVTGAF